ncbi:hypothetical protein [Caenimonas aquaedulcis]|uniref:Uncharacterized protein n=1 Tax=Caenimonas aquaedulcis TaxID=2793270 RepID=A0A931H2F6_9BURK|nr:hypothetical protein [Caenimonas aquaedulcis]MBG9387269.1 hypothetical protein [Caenimonas aquaedulcis]
MSGDTKDTAAHPNSPSKDATNVPRSGSGSDTALEVMIRKRQLDTHGESESQPGEDAAGTPPAN